MSTATSIRPKAASMRVLGSRLAAEFSGVDVRGMDEAAFARIYDAFLAHSILVIRDQTLTVPELLAFSRRFGPLRVHINRSKNRVDHPELMELDNQAVDGQLADLERIGLAAEWHSDLGYEAVPAKATGLYAIQLPSHGGNTRFNDMEAAYNALPVSLRRVIDGRRARFKWGGRERKHMHVLTPEQRDSAPVLHDIVRAHPETGRRALFVSPAQILGIEGLADADNDAVLAEIFAYTSKAEADYSHTWRLGDIVIWDNRSVIHSATNDYPLHERRLHWRVTIMERPEVAAK